MLLGDYIKVSTGKLDANAASENGKYPFFTCSKEILKIDNYTFDCECVLLAGNGDLNVKYYNGKFNAYQRTYVIESLNKDVLDVKFLYLFFEFYLFKLKHVAIGGVIKYIKLENITKANIFIPSIKEQKEIVYKIEKLKFVLSKVEKQLNLLDELIKSRFVEMFGDPELNPKNFEKVTFSSLGELARGKSKHRPRNDAILLGGPYPLIQTGDVASAETYISEFHSTYSEAGLKQSKMWPKGTLCITIAANIAESAILTFDACFPDSVVGFMPNKDTNSLFIKFQLDLLKDYLNSKATAVAQKNLNLEKLSSSLFIKPPKEIQDKFAAFVEQIDKSKFVVQKRIELYKELLNKKMDEYFN